jgi:hypothetical protein
MYVVDGFLPTDNPTWRRTLVAWTLKKKKKKEKKNFYIRT